MQKSVATAASPEEMTTTTEIASNALQKDMLCGAPFLFLELIPWVTAGSLHP